MLRLFLLFDRLDPRIDIGDVILQTFEWRHYFSLTFGNETLGQWIWVLPSHDFRNNNFKWRVYLIWPEVPFEIRISIVTSNTVGLINFCSASEICGGYFHKRLEVKQRICRSLRVNQLTQ